MYSPYFEADQAYQAPSGSGTQALRNTNLGDQVPNPNVDAMSTVTMRPPRCTREIAKAPAAPRNDAVYRIPVTLVTRCPSAPNH